jgi:ferrous iron transport protein A
MYSALSSIKSGQRVSVVSIKDCALKPKLMEMGFVQGKELTILFRAPFGDPIAVDMNGYVLSLRLDEAALIDVNQAISEQRF